MSGAGVTEPDHVRAAGGGKKARAHFEHPEPEVAATPWEEEVHGPVPSAAVRLGREAVARGWTGCAYYARGTTDPGETKQGVLVESCSIRMVRSGVKVWAAWWRPATSEGRWVFSDAQYQGLASGATPIGITLTATELTAFVEMAPLPRTVVTDEVYRLFGTQRLRFLSVSQVRELIATHLAGEKANREAEKVAAAERKAAREAARVEKLLVRSAKIREILGGVKPVSPERTEKLGAELEEVQRKLSALTGGTTWFDEVSTPASPAERAGE